MSRLVLLIKKKQILNFSIIFVIFLFNLRNLIFRSYIFIYAVSLSNATIRIRNEKTVGEYVN